MSYRKSAVKSRARFGCGTACLAAFLCLASGASQASFLSGEALDTAADVIALVVLFVVPPAVIAVFWLVHVLPEKIAEKREHPQKEAIKVLCLLSLVFGGLLWPFAWLLAYTKPVLHRMAYGRDKHDDYYKHLAENDAAESLALSDEVAKLREDIEGLAARGQLPEELEMMREQLANIQNRLVVAEAGEETR
jgi:CBS domain containing-hemolysin-like protein